MPDDRSPKRPAGETGGKNWELWIDEIIRDAQAKGAFDNLPGKGKPLPRRRNPYLPAERQIAYDIVQDSGHTLPWLDDAKDIDGRIAAARQKLQQRYAWYQKQQEMHTQQASALEHSWSQQRRDFEKEVSEINRLIDTYNLKTPLAQLHKMRLIPAREYERLGIK